MIVYAGIALAFIASLFFPKSKAVTALLFVFILSVYSLIWSEGYDLYYYWVHYTTVAADVPSMSAGFDWMTIAIRSLGFSFFGFRLICNTIWMAMIFAIVLRYSTVPNVVLALTMLFPNMLYGVNMRTGISYGLVLLCAGFLQEKGKGGVIKYLIGNAVAILIHPTSAVFLLLLLCKIKINKKVFYIVIAAMTAAVAVLLNTSLPFRIVSSFTSNERVLQWVREGASGDLLSTLTAAILAAIQIGCGIVCEYCYQYIVFSRKDRIQDARDASRMRYYGFVQQVNTVMYASIPFLFLSVSSYRYLCTVYVLNAIVMTESAVQIRCGKPVVRYVNIVIAVGLTAALFAYIMVKWQGGAFEYLSAYADNLWKFINGGLRIFGDAAAAMKG